MRTRSGAGRPGRKIIVVGLGLIGSYLVSLLARMREIGWVVLVDLDRYEAKNLACQEIRAADVGRWKALAQARRLRRLAPDLRVDAHVGAVESLPLGAFRADALLSCVDSLATRLHLAEACWHVGTPLIDGAVDAGGLLTRVDVYLPGGEAACMHCSLDDDQYAALPQRYPCQPAASFRDGVTPTDAPAELGAACSALLANELRKLLTGRIDQLAASREVMIGLAFHRLVVTELRRSSRCRFGHAAPGVDVLDRSAGDVTVAEAFALAGPDAAEDADTVFAVEGRRWITQLACACGHTRSLLRTDAALEARPVRCGRCGSAMHPSPVGFVDRIARGDLPCKALGAPLRRLGVLPGDVLRIEPAGGEARWFEIAQT